MQRNTTPTVTNTPPKTPAETLFEPIKEVRDYILAFLGTFEAISVEISHKEPDALRSIYTDEITKQYKNELTYPNDKYRFLAQLQSIVGNHPTITAESENLWFIVRYRNLSSLSLNITALKTLLSSIEKIKGQLPKDSRRYNKMQQVVATAINALTAIHQLLHVTVLDGDTKVVDLLIRYGADRTVKNENEDTPIKSAVKENKWEVVKVFARYPITDQYDYAGYGNAMNYAIIDNDPAISSSSMIESLLKAGANPNCWKKNDMSSTHLVIEYAKDVAFLKLLIRYGANLLETNKAGDNLLQAARKKGLPLHIDFLEKKYSLALHHAINANQEEEVKNLLAAGASANADFGLGQTPLRVAIKQKSSIKILKSLVEAGASLNIIDLEGQTPLSLAAKEKNHVAEMYLHSKLLAQNKILPEHKKENTTFRGVKTLPQESSIRIPYYQFFPPINQAAQPIGSGQDKTPKASKTNTFTS